MAGKSQKFDDWTCEDGLLRIQGWARDGLTEEQICHNMGIGRTTFLRWKKRCPAIQAHLKKGKEVVDILVENALLKSALGYTYDEIKTEIFPDGTQKVTHTLKEVQPNSTAQIFWLKNRKPKEWRDRRETAVQVQEQDVQETAKRIQGLLDGMEGQAKDSEEAKGGHKTP